VAVPALVRMLERNDGFKFVAAVALGRLRQTTVPARAALLRAVQTHNNDVAAAAWALIYKVIRERLAKAQNERPIGYFLRDVPARYNGAEDSSEYEKILPTSPP